MQAVFVAREMISHTVYSKSSFVLKPLKGHSEVLIGSEPPSVCCLRCFSVFFIQLSVLFPVLLSNPTDM